MTANIDPNTGIAYGYISANVLDPEVIDSLQSGTDVYYDDALLEEQIEVAHKPEAQKAALEERPATLDLNDETAVFEHTLQYVKDNWSGSMWESHFNDCYSPDEPIHEGTKDGVKYRTSWLGGALNVCIFESPYVTHKARRASPCVPNAGILDTLDGDVTAYNVPDDWRREPDEGEIAKWIREHGRDFGAMPEEVRTYWTRIYKVLHGMIDPAQVKLPVRQVETGRQREKTMRFGERYSTKLSRPDCGEAGHADGACGNAQCLPAKATLADVEFVLSYGFHIGPRDPALIGVIFSPKARERVLEDAAYMVYDPSDDEDGFMLTGDNLAELVVETRRHIELKS